MQIDVDKFMEIMQAALLAASKEESQPTHNRQEEQSSASLDPPKKKRGRPKKNSGPLGESKVEPSSTVKQSFEKEFVGEEPDPLKEEPLPVQIRQSSYLAPAKAPGFDTSNRSKAKTAQFEPPKEPNKFDVMGWGTLRKEDSLGPGGKKLQYPEHTEPRPTKKKEQYRCDKCSRMFEAYPSEVPQARPMSVTGGDGVQGRESFSPLLFCDNCIGTR